MFIMRIQTECRSYQESRFLDAAEQALGTKGFTISQCPELQLMTINPTVPLILVGDEVICPMAVINEKMQRKWREFTQRISELTSSSTSSNRVDMLMIENGGRAFMQGVALGNDLARLGDVSIFLPAQVGFEPESSPKTVVEMHTAMGIMAVRGRVWEPPVSVEAIEIGRNHEEKQRMIFYTLILQPYQKVHYRDLPHAF